MSVFVIIETINDTSVPVAARPNEELALAHCTTLAGKCKGVFGRVETTPDGARFISPDIEYTVHKIDDNDSI